MSKCIRDTNIPRTSRKSVEADSSMTAVNWDAFAQLPGSPEINFEQLCRALIRRHYGRYGEFKQLANQAGVEFHLKLQKPCDLGEPPRWFGWQCKWFQLRNGQNLGATRRNNIEEGLQKTRKYLPEITNWVLWTRHTLTTSDQEWFYGLAAKYPGVSLELLTSADVEVYLNGPATSLRETYFGDLIITPELLAEQQQIAVAPIRHRYQAEVHQVVPQEDALRMNLAQQGAWEFVRELGLSLQRGTARLDALSAASKAILPPEVGELVDDCLAAARLLRDIYTTLGRVDLDTIDQLLAAPTINPGRYQRLLSRLRSLRSECALVSTNLVADLYAMLDALEQLSNSVQARVIAVLGEAGGGKSELAVRLTCQSADHPGGVLLLGRDFHAGQTLDQLAAAFKIAGRPVQTFEQLVDALDSAGQRLGSRIPIVVDGLNESEDPKAWKVALSRAQEILKRAPYVLLIVTLRNPFADECLPKDAQQVELSGFTYDPESAIRAYFSYYKIDAVDADLPIDLLTHPLTLRIFCEVANPHRAQIVGVAALPRSLTALFEAYFEGVSERIADLSPPNARVYPDEVRQALDNMAAHMWGKHLRSIERNQAHGVIGHTGSWHTSLLRSLESEGVVVRTAETPGTDGFAFAYDLMAGYLFARSLLRDPNIVQWLSSTDAQTKLAGNGGVAHPLAWDTFRALAGLFPRNSVQRKQLWEVVPEGLRLSALALAIRADPSDIDRETVENFAKAMRADESFAKRAFKELQSTRASTAHPFDSTFLDRVLGEMSNTERDLSWSSWLLDHEEAITHDINRLDDRWSSGRLDAHELGRARWVKWVLTTNSRYLRDVATRALYKLALRLPKAYFPLAIESLESSDPYVPERMLAAAYGAALSAWSDPDNQEMRTALPVAAAALVKAAFRPDAKGATRHAVLRQYCLGVVDLGRRLDQGCVSSEDATYLIPPFNDLPSPFTSNPKITEKMIEVADRAAIRMDFGNYTLGRLIPGRGNYNFEHQGYAETRKSIVRRMIELGYDPEKFEAIDRGRQSYGRGHLEGKKIDRFGKKYSWIAFMEMWGWREDQGVLPDWRVGERSSDSGIDASFPPTSSPTWTPPLPNLFTSGPKKLGNWILEGPIPDYSMLLTPSNVDGVDGDWVMLGGFIEETDPSDYREVFTFLRGLFVSESEVGKLLEIFGSMQYPGNTAIPDDREHHYRFAGEMPFLKPPGFSLAASNGDEHGEARDTFPSFSESASASISIELPVHTYSWESYHSELNPEHGVLFPAPQICERLGLRYRAGHWDLFDDRNVASLFRRIGVDDLELRGKVLYLRKELLLRYLRESNQTLVWLIWGERGMNYRANYEGAELHGRWEEYKHIHKRAVVWDADVQEGSSGSARSRRRNKPRAAPRKKS